MKNYLHKVSGVKNKLDRKFRSFFWGSPKKVLFEHIPKCGGMTFNHFLKSQYEDDKIFHIVGEQKRECIDRFKSLPKEIRSNYDLVLGHGAHELLELTHPDKITVTIFRDPIDRIVSHYFYVLRNPQHYLHEEIKNKKISLEDYVTSGLSDEELRNNYVTRFLQIPLAEAEQDPDRAVERAYNLIREKYTVVGILDDIDAAKSAIARAANFSNYQKFSHKVLNATPDRLKLQDIDPSTLETIAKVNFLDVRLYRQIKQLAASTTAPSTVQ